MKIAALDVGDVWTGSALADALGISCKPYETVKTTELSLLIQKLISQEMVTTIIVGNPQTLKGTDSDQTEKVHLFTKQLKEQHFDITFVLWDERLSSKRATLLQGSQARTEKQKQHSIAAAFILQSYLDHKAFTSNFSND